MTLPTAYMHSPELAQATHDRAVTHASGSDGGPQADPPLLTSRTTLIYGPGLPSGPACGFACGPSSSYLLIDGLSPHVLLTL